MIFKATLNILTVGLLALTLSPMAQAGVASSLMQTAPTMAPGTFEVNAHADLIMNQGGGFNISPHLRTGLVDHFVDADFYFGTGTTDFFGGGLLKYNLLPDIEGQIGLSFLGGLAYIHDEGTSSTLFTAAILGSKHIDTSFGAVSPYGALELEGLLRSLNNYVPVTLAVGGKWDFVEIRPWNFYSELQIDLHDSYWALSVGAGYPF